MEKWIEQPAGASEGMLQYAGDQKLPAAVETADALKAVMREMVAPVVILTTGTITGERYAMTVSSFTSVSLDPPSVLVCVRKTSSVYEPVCRLKNFCINLLASQQQSLADYCARGPSDRRFACGGWHFTVDGLPFLPDARTVLRCELAAVPQMGTHAVLLAQVRHIMRGEEGDLLAYRNGNYLSL